VLIAGVRIVVTSAQLIDLQPALVEFGYQLKFAGLKLDKKNFGIGAKSDPFFRVRSYSAQGGYAPTIYKSEVLYDTLNPNWAPFVVYRSQFYKQNNPDPQLLIEVYDYDKKDGDVHVIGTVLIHWHEFKWLGSRWTLQDKDKKEYEKSLIILIY
jgi:hypothetical protein